MRRFLLKSIVSLVVLLFATSASAIDITVDVAKKAAVHFMKEVTGKTKEITETITETKDGNTTIYAFNFANGGWIMISASYNVDPVLGYNTIGEYTKSEDVENDNFKFVLERYSNYVSESLKSGALLRGGSAESTDKWNKLLSTSPLYGPSVQKITVPDLLNIPERGGEVKWGQSAPYNDQCPITNVYSWPFVSNIEGRALVGCVAVALSQIMWKWQWPSHAYFTNRRDETFYGYFDWSNMPTVLNKYTSSDIEKDHVQKLLHLNGESVNMSYGIAGSGAYEIFAWETLKKWGYDSYRIISRNKVDESTWYTLLKNELINGRPVFFASGAHAYVLSGCDDEDNFYLNMGWNGSQNGYYNLAGKMLEETANNGLAHDVVDDVNSQVALVGIVPNRYNTMGATNCLELDEVKSGENITLDYEDEVTVACGDKLDVLEDGHLNVEAENAIHFNSGFSAKTGSKVSARIADYKKLSSDKSTLMYASILSEEATKLKAFFWNANSWILCVRTKDRKPGLITFTPDGIVLHHSYTSDMVLLKSGSLDKIGDAATLLDLSELEDQKLEDLVYELAIFNEYGMHVYKGNFTSTNLEDMEIIPNGDLHVRSGNDMNIVEESLSMPTYVDGLDAANGISIYPNPTEGAFTITVGEEEATIEVIDALGRVIITDTISSEKTYDLSSYAKGIYTVKVIADGKVNTQSLIVR